MFQATYSVKSCDDVRDEKTTEYGPLKHGRMGRTSSLVLSLKQHLFLSRIKRSKKVNWLQFLCVIGIIGQVCTKFMDPT